jgi:hypothetical protein
MGLQELRKTTKTLSQESRSPGRDLNPRPPECEAAVLTTLPRRSATILMLFVVLLSPSKQTSEQSLSWATTDILVRPCLERDYNP